MLSVDLSRPMTSGNRLRVQVTARKRTTHKPVMALSRRGIGRVFEYICLIPVH